MHFSTPGNAQPSSTMIEPHQFFTVRHTPQSSPFLVKQTD